MTSGESHSGPPVQVRGWRGDLASAAGDSLRGF